MAICRIIQRKGIPDDYTAMVAALMAYGGIMHGHEQGHQNECRRYDNMECMMLFNFAHLPKNTQQVLLYLRHIIHSLNRLAVSSDILIGCCIPKVYDGSNNQCLNIHDDFDVSMPHHGQLDTNGNP